MGTLSIVGTPIGNLEDITLRALRTLTEADVIYCEDTRVTAKLLARHAIATPLKRLDANVEALKAGEVGDRLEAGEHVAYVTDAGTPGISDPGSRLVAAVRERFGEEVRIEAVPGPSALTAALSIAGISADPFVFLGFLPHKKGRQTMLSEIAQEPRAIVLYESTHRIGKLMGELADAIREREVAVVREITKRFEEVLRGDAASVHAAIEAAPEHAKGEFVVIIAPVEKRRS
ncbi:MAG TPA: 16S rRNA (cytidine(1402)-2'-O)-methyltransferase [Candidatus Paceibacterota bacterium]|nr:16S rRNA (cytidine(1402)-2'-O)-methyltransferase [Candidatus Paceibacterota bacterium]